MQRRQRRGAVTVAWSVAVQWRRRVGGASRRFSTSPDQLGFLWWVKRTTNLFFTVPLTPHLILLYVCYATGAHQPPTGWAPPIRARVKARLVRWVQTVEINTNNDLSGDFVHKT